jgi:hypothetical protein
MNIRDISPSLTDSINRLIEKGLEIKTVTESPSVSDLYQHLSIISRQAEKESEKYLSQKKPEIASAIFILVSEIFRLLSRSLFKQKGVSEMFLSAAVSWSRRAENIIETHQNSYRKTSSSLSQGGNYSESSEYKTKAASLDYKVIRTEAVEVLYKIIYDLLNSLKRDPREILDFLQEQEPPLDEKEELEGKADTNNYSRFASREVKESISLKDTVGAIVNRASQEPLEFVTADDIKIENDYEPAPKTGYYKWKVYLDVDNKVADKIDNVTYTLHPTFYNPIRTVQNDPTGKYMLQSNGWGEFEIKADIKLKNNNVITKYHWLNLGSRGIHYST